MPSGTAHVSTTSTSVHTTATEGQGEKFHGLFVDAVRKSGLPRKGTQLVLEEEGPELVKECLDSLRRRVEWRADMIVRHFKVDRTKTRQQMLDATGRKQYVDKNMLATMPTDGPEEGDLYFFPLKRFVPISEVAAELESRGFVIDPVAQMQVNADDPAFADEHPNGVQWGSDSYAAFYHWHDGRGASVVRDGSGWDGSWWLCGRRKS